MEPNISDCFQEIVRDNGDEVLIHTKTCIEYKLTHGNCRGCPSELGCAKVASMLSVSMTPMIYTPKNYQDYEAMRSSIQNKLDIILKARSSEEIKSVRW